MSGVRFLVVVAGLLGLVAAGCGGGGSEGDSVENRAVDEVADALARYECQNFSACCDAEGFTVGDADGCFGRRRVSWRRDFERTLSDFAIELDEDAARRCGEQLSGMGSSCGGGNAPACRRFMLGTRAVGESCEDTLECVGGSVSETHCADGVCRRSGLPGDRCFADRECAGFPLDARCSALLTADAPGYCVTSGAAREGEPCGRTCLLSGSCLGPSSSRDPASGVGTYCLASDGLFCAAEGACVAGLGLGAACDQAGTCGAEAWCDRGTCVPLGGVGDPCRDGTCGVALDCTGAGSIDPVVLEPTGTCGVPLPDGASCAPGALRCERECDLATRTCGPSFQEVSCAMGLVDSLAPVGTSAASVFSLK